jgi:hypothetical protein
MSRLPIEAALALPPPASLKRKIPLGVAGTCGSERCICLKFKSLLSLVLSLPKRQIMHRSTGPELVVHSCKKDSAKLPLGHPNRHANRFHSLLCKLIPYLKIQDLIAWTLCLPLWSSSIPAPYIVSLAKCWAPIEPGRNHAPFVRRSSEQK